MKTEVLVCEPHLCAESLGSLRKLQAEEAVPGAPSCPWPAVGTSWHFLSPRLWAPRVRAHLHHQCPGQCQATRLLVCLLNLPCTLILTAHKHAPILRAWAPTFCRNPTSGLDWKSTGAIFEAGGWSSLPYPTRVPQIKAAVASTISPPSIPHLRAAVPPSLLPKPMADITSGSQHASRAQIFLSTDRGWQGRETTLNTGQVHSRMRPFIHQILVKTPG